jgi:hypothetical protein
MEGRLDLDQPALRKRARPRCQAPAARFPGKFPPPSSRGGARDCTFWLPPVPICRERAARMRPHVAIGALSVLRSHWHSKRACVKIPVANATG